jgi:hypothetical protein
MVSSLPHKALKSPFSVAAISNTALAAFPFHPASGHFHNHMSKTKERHFTLTDGPKGQVEANR